MQDKALGGVTRRFLADFARYSGRRGVVALILVGLGAVAEGVGVLLLVPLLAILTGGDGQGWVDEAARWVLAPVAGLPRSTALALMLAVFAALMAIRSVVIMARDVTLAEMNFGFVEAIRLRLAHSLAVTDWGAISRLSHARVVHLLTIDVQRCSAAALFSLQVGVALIGVVVQMTLAFILSPPLAALSLLMLLTTALALGPLLRRARDGGQTLGAAHREFLRDTTQFLGGLKQALSHNREDAFIAQVETALGALHRTQIDLARQQTLSRLALAAIAALIGGAGLWIGYGVLGLSAPVLVALLFVLARLSGPIGTIQRGAMQLASSLPAYDNVLNLEAELGVGGPRPSARAVSLPPQPAIAFENVTFLHAGDSDSPRGISEVSLVIQPGEHIGVAGPSGAGKTTFADLLAGLYPPQTGRVSVAGRPLVGDLARAWRDRIAYVPQDPFLFHDTVRGNLLWGAPDADETALWAALALTGADAVVRRMDGGLDCLVGEHGSLVSGGERQRLALSRALLRKPHLLILDEATSALDAPSEEAILQRVRAAFPRMTIVIVAHRRESLAGCERRLTFERGRLADDAVATAGAA